MKDQSVLRVVSKFHIPFFFVFGFYVITHGELGPGGGFQGGVILASGFILYSLVFGLKASRRVLPWPVLDFLVAFGLLIYAGVGVVGILGGRVFLDYRALGGDPQHAEAWGMTLVEYGVGITVCAVMVTIFNKIAEGKTAETVHDGKTPKTRMIRRLSGTGGARDIETSVGD